MTVPEIWPGQDRGGNEKKKKKKRKKKKKEKNELVESHKASPTGIANNSNINISAIPIMKKDSLDIWSINKISYSMTEN